MYCRTLKTVYERVRPSTVRDQYRTLAARLNNEASRGPRLADLKKMKFTNSSIVGVKVKNFQGVMVEIRAEKKANISVLLMLHFLENVLDACHFHLEKGLFFDNHTQISMDQNKLKSIKDKYGLTVASHTKSISDDAGGLVVPEKAILLRSMMSVQYYGLTADTMRKDAMEKLSFQFGNCGILLAYYKNFENSMSDTELDAVLNNICTHILVRKPSNRCLLGQPYMFDERVSVAEFAALNRIRLVDFERFECDVESKAGTSTVTSGLIEHHPQLVGSYL